MAKKPSERKSDLEKHVEDLEERVARLEELIRDLIDGDDIRPINDGSED